jgi:outer membrane protein OmpA-like peptidoglycan-associated protein
MIEALVGFVMVVATALGLGDDGTIVVLLENPDGTIGAVSVANRAGTQVLDKARQGTRVGDALAVPAAPRQYEEAEIRDLFGKALDAQPVRPVSYLLYFATGSDEPTPASRPELDKALEDIAGRPFPQVTLIGHTDRVGNSETNYRLALDRANGTRGLLTGGGVPEGIIQVRSHGEGDPLVRTADEVPEARNRRVEIMVR